MSRRLLIIDDEAAVRSALADYFTSHGYKVDCARSYAAALARLDARRYDMVITDLRMSGTGSSDGLDVIQYVRKRSPATPIILITAYGSAEIEREAYKRGASAVFNKDASLAELSQLVSKLLPRES